jgi:hypothetical protein
LGFGPLASPSHLAGSNPTDWVLGWSNRPSPVPSLTSLHSELLLRPRSPPPPEDSGRLRWFPPLSLEANNRLHDAYLFTEWIWNPSLVRGDPLLLWIRVPPNQPPPSSPPMAASRAGAEEWCCGDCGDRATPVEASPMGCSWCCHGATAGEVVPGPRLVGRAGTAPPCQLGQHLGAGECDCLSSLFPYLLLYLCHYPRPFKPCLIVLCLSPGYAVWLVNNLLDYYPRMYAVDASYLL